MEQLKCPECHSTNLVKCGYSIRHRERIQRYRCNQCKRIFIPENKKEEAH